jgi:cyanoexosortase A
MLLKGLSLFWFETELLQLLPLGLALGLGLLASGWRGLGQYWREGLLVLTLAIPAELLLTPIDRLFQIRQITAQIAAFLLYYLGFDAVVRNGITIDLPSGSVTVALYCTGIEAGILLLKLSVIFAVLFALPFSQKLLAPLAAIGAALLISVVRVALLAVVVSNPPVFDYWHGSGGGQIFSTAAILGFGLFCRWILDRYEQQLELDLEDELSD